MSETKKEWKLPKNTRQVGDGSGDKKLYVEDYVATYLNRLSGQKETAKAASSGNRKRTESVSICIRGCSDRNRRFSYE